MFCFFLVDRLECSKENVWSPLLNSPGDPSCESLSCLIPRVPRWSPRDSSATINHTGWLFTFCPLFLPVDRAETSLSFRPPWASFSADEKNCGRSAHFPAPSVIPVLVLHCCEGGFVYHTVCSRRIGKDYTSYKPYSRYIGMCVSVEYVHVNTWGVFLFVGGDVLRLKCLLSGTIHIAVGCHRFNVVVCVKQWVISSQEKWTY